MSVEAVATKIATVLDGASSGMVHDYFRLTADEATRNTLFMAGGRLHTWMVALSDGDPYLTTRRPANFELATYAFSLHGYYAVNDAAASEKAFRLEVQSVIAAFRANKKLDDTVIEAGPAQWRDAGYRTFVGVLCHYARLDLAVLEQVEPAV